MPTYEYACTECGQHIEVFQRHSDDPLTICGVCGGPLRKVFHPAGILFKGSGFYSTDSRSKAREAEVGSSDSKGSESKGSESKGSESTGSESKGSESKGAGSQTADSKGSGSSADGSNTGSSSSGKPTEKSA